MPFQDRVEEGITYIWKIRLYFWNEEMLCTFLWPLQVFAWQRDIRIDYTENAQQEQDHCDNNVYVHGLTFDSLSFYRLKYRCPAFPLLNPKQYSVHCTGIILQYLCTFITFFGSTWNLSLTTAAINPSPSRRHLLDSVSTVQRQDMKDDRNVKSNKHCE